MTCEMKTGNQLRTSLLAGLLLMAPASVSAGLAKSGGSIDITGTVVGEHGATTPSGTVAGAFDPETDILAYTITYSGLSGPVMAAHFHGPAGPAAEAGVLVPIKAPYASPIGGAATLTPTQATELRQGKIYVNLHTAAHPNGEARAQLTVK